MVFQLSVVSVLAVGYRNRLVAPRLVGRVRYGFVDQCCSFDGLRSKDGVGEVEVRL